jgi:hypothetical protein
MWTPTLLTPEQEEQIDPYQQKWRQYALQTTALDRTRVSAILQDAYALTGTAGPAPIFCQSSGDLFQRLYGSSVAKDDRSQPHALLGILAGVKLTWQRKAEFQQNPFKQLVTQLERQVQSSLYTRLQAQRPAHLSLKDVLNQPSADLRPLLGDPVWARANWDTDLSTDPWVSLAVRLDQLVPWFPGREDLYLRWCINVCYQRWQHQVEGRLPYRLFQPLVSKAAHLQPAASTWERGARSFLQNVPWLGRFTSQMMLAACIWIDFVHRVLDVPVDQDRWRCLQALMQECGWILWSEGVCYICERPAQIHLDARDRLHAEAQPTLEFADGDRLYCWHGIQLPEQYGQLPPQEWSPQWLLQETDSELRRILLQEIGYPRLCQELHPEELDHWKDYRLLRMEGVDREPVYLLKQTPPGSGAEKVIRVPPDSQSARAAATWINWGIDPEDFEQQT